MNVQWNLCMREGVCLDGCMFVLMCGRVAYECESTLSMAMAVTSAVYKRNNTGPRMLLCGTPHLTSVVFDLDPAQVTLCSVLQK